MSADSPNILVREGKGIGYVTSESVFLPEYINYFRDRNLNRNIFLNKALIAGAVLKYKVSYKTKSPSPLDRALQITDKKELITKKLESDLPGYKYFHDNLLMEYTKNIKLVTLSHYDHKFLTLPKEKLSSLQKLEEIPAIAFALSTQLMIPSHDVENDFQDYMIPKNKSKNKQTELKKHTSPEVEVVSLKKEREKENPVAHSFEKLETADEYKGGYKTPDTSDELMQHSTALEELTLSKVTREGGVAQSVYKSSTTDFFKDVILKSQKPRYEFFKYYQQRFFRGI
jgi:nitric oxide reductase NorD protein